MGSHTSKPRQPFQEFFELHHKVTHKFMEQNVMTEEKYTEFLVSQISRFFNSNHQYFKDGMKKYVTKNSKPIYKCYKQFLKDNCMAQNWSASCINPSSLEEEFYKYVVEFYQCSIQFSITKEDYLSIIDDVHSFMNFLSSIKKSVIKPKLWPKQSKEQYIQPLSNSVEDLLFSIGKKVYSNEIQATKEWMQSNRKTTFISQSELQINKNAFKYLRAFQKSANTYSKKQQCLLKLFQNIKSDSDQQRLLVYGLSTIPMQDVFIELLILSRLGSRQASHLIETLSKQVPNAAINS